jgi:hypothetical protein
VILIFATVRTSKLTQLQWNRMYHQISFGDEVDVAVASGCTEMFPSCPLHQFPSYLNKGPLLKDLSEDRADRKSLSFGHFLNSIQANVRIL